MTTEEEERLVTVAQWEYVRFPVQSHRERMRLVVRAVIKELQRQQQEENA